MKLKVKEKEKKALELEMEDVDYSIGDIIRHELLQDEKVSFAGFYDTHPLIRNISMRVESPNPKESLLIAIEKALKRVKEISSKAEEVIK